ncbi:AMP-binding protein [Ramlibacter sp. MAHUQ-53]|uniref:AMP-binding protein n=1 Tax=unclassified Ramlibacter TaxID=2617605 RepID=UPI0036318B38
MTPAAPADLVHAPLAHWAAVRGDAPALADGRQALDFRQLHEAVQRGAQALAAARAPRTVLVDGQRPTLDQVVQFLAIIASGRCAAVGDPDWSAPVRERVHAALPSAPADAAPPSPGDPFYIGFTSGSTGLPKGFRRDHRSWAESFRLCVDTFGPDAAACVLAPGRISHSLFLFAMLLGVWSGGGAVVQERFSAARALETLREGRTPCLVAVPSQLAMMLELAARRALAPVEGVRLILISGARWMRERTPQLRALFPRARIVEFYGASETSFIAWMDADENAPAQAVGRPFAGVDLEIRERQADGSGAIFVRSPMLFTDYVGGQADPTAAVRDGAWLSVGDMGWIDDAGRLCLAGRRNRMVVTQGKNLFPEEVEAVLGACAGVAAASVHGVPDPVRGQQVVAVVRPAPGVAPATAQDLAAACRERLEPYKAPRRFLACEDWPLTTSGKTDHARIAAMLAMQEGTPCLRPLS